MTFTSPGIKNCSGCRNGPWGQAGVCLRINHGMWLLHKQPTGLHRGWQASKAFWRQQHRAVGPGLPVVLGLDWPRAPGQEASAPATAPADTARLQPLRTPSPPPLCPSTLLQGRDQKSRCSVLRCHCLACSPPAPSLLELPPPQHSCKGAPTSVLQAKMGTKDPSTLSMKTESHEVSPCLCPSPLRLQVLGTPTFTAASPLHACRLPLSLLLHKVRKTSGEGQQGQYCARLQRRPRVHCDHHTLRSRDLLDECGMSQPLWAASFAHRQAVPAEETLTLS
uniref:uncharacterized protein LOC118531150 n=1 Tax=Halichoerus grypus TaxID=9711 RepID=UPI0016598E20|nr:uncharacterized protein LOC118531150 [Halichoerus grypus]XP_035940922.1 uncharacterized protein LOC118531150 [Halichoerus grypus]